MRVPFNTPYYAGNESHYIQQAFSNKQLSGDGEFTARVSEILNNIFSSQRVLLTHSCTAALEMAAILLDIAPGDEIIMPSFTFVSTANAFSLRGGIPVFVDIEPSTQNLDLSVIETAITKNTKAIVVVHYAGISCDMSRLRALADSYNLFLVEDAAQAIYSRFDNRPLGSFGDLATVSFHETKNISCGEGGCLIINNSNFIERAEIIREKGTNRSLFFRGAVDKYTWVDIGSSYLPGEVSAAFLLAQLEQGESITQKRLVNWEKYHAILSCSEYASLWSLMEIPSLVKHNAHMFYLILNSDYSRDEFISFMKAQGVGCVFHYVPLHSSPAGQRLGRTSGSLNNTSRAAEQLVRLPMCPEFDIAYVLNMLEKWASQQIIGAA